MSRSFIMYDSKDNIAEQRKAARAVADAITKGDSAIRALQRRQDLFPAEQDRRIAEARQAMEAEVREHAQALDAKIAEARKEATYADEAPDAEEAARRTYWATAAMVELSGLTSPTDVLARVQAVAASGNAEQAREYVRAATGRAPAQALGVIQRQVEPPEARMHRSFAASVDTMEYHAANFHRWVGEHMQRAGFISPEAKAGLAPEEGISTRQLALWIDALDGRCGDAFSAHEAYEAKIAEEGIATALANGYGGGDGWDAPGDEQPTGDPQAQQDASADAEADQADAEVHA